jgi:hypothetical protein
MFGNNKKSKKLDESENQTDKSEKKSLIKVLAYALPNEGHREINAIHEYEGFEINDEPLGASVSFLDYDGIVLFAGTFETIMKGDYWDKPSIKCIALSDLDLREREVHTVIKKQKFIIFLIPMIYRGDQYRSRISNTDLFRRLLESFGIDWHALREPVSHLDSKISEFQFYIERNGAAYVGFNNRLHKGKVTAKCMLAKKN